MNQTCLNKSDQTVQDFIRHCGSEEKALKIVNRCNLINGDYINIFQTDVFKNSIKENGTVATFDKIIDAFKNDSLGVFFNLGKLNDRIAINVNQPKSYGSDKITPDENTIFVFGSNPEGKHGKGAAKVAVEQFGAIQKQGEGLQGHAYALPTKRINQPGNKEKIPTAQMTEQFEGAKRPEIISDNTFDAIIEGKITATTRSLEKSKSFDFWKGLKVGDVVALKSDAKSKERLVYVRITEPLTKLDKNTSAEEWSKKEGWNVSHFNSEIKPLIDKEWAYQIEYEFIGAYGKRTILPHQITENIKRMYETARQYPNLQFKVAYTNDLNEETLNGYTGEELILMFKEAGEIPSNVYFSETWVKNWNKVKPSKYEIEQFKQQTSQEKTNQDENSTEELESSILTPEEIDILRIKRREEAWKLEDNGASPEEIYEKTGLRKNEFGQYEDSLSEEANKFSKEYEKLKYEFHGVQSVYMDEKWLNSHNMTLTDYNVIKQAVIDKISQQISMFLYDFDEWADIKNIDTSTKQYKKLKEISENGDIEKLLNIQYFTFKDLFTNAIKQLRRNKNTRSYVFNVLSSSEDTLSQKEINERESLLALLESQVINQLNSLYSIKINENKVSKIITLEELSSSENHLDSLDKSENNTETSEDDSDENDGEFDEFDDFDSIATMLAAKDGINVDRVKKDKQTIIQLFSGIPNMNKNRISEYGSVHFYSPWTIYNELIKICYDCKNSDDLRKRLKDNNRYPYVKQILQRMNASPKFATLAWQTFRGQYRIFYDLSTGSDGKYDITFPNLKLHSMFYTKAIEDFVERRPENPYFEVVREGKTTKAVYKNEHKETKIKPIFSLLSQIYKWLENTNVIPNKKSASFSSKDTFAISAAIRGSVERPIKDIPVQEITDAFNELRTKNDKINEDASFLDVFMEGVKQLGCTELGFDITKTELLSTLSNFIANNDTYMYSDVFNQLSNTVIKTIDSKNGIASLFNYIGLTLDSKNSFIIGKDKAAKILSHFYRGRDGYWSFGHCNELSYFSEWLQSITCDDYKNWYESYCKNDYYFEAYHNAHEYFETNKSKLGNAKLSNHDILYKLYKKALKKASENKGGEKIVPESGDLPLYSYLYFAVQDDKKLNGLFEYELTANRVSSFLNFSNSVVKDTRSLFTGYVLADKSQQVAMVNERDNDLQSCVSSLTVKTLMELTRMYNIYNSIVTARKEGTSDLLTKEPNFSADIYNEGGDYKVNFKDSGGIRFMYFPELNKYLWEINNISNDEDNLRLNHPHEFSDDELKFINSLKIYLYGNSSIDRVAAKTFILNSLVGISSTEEKSSDNTRDIKEAATGLISKILDNKAKELSDVIFNCDKLPEKIGFVKNIQAKEWQVKPREGGSIMNNMNAERFLKYFVYNSAASLAEQTFMHHNDIVRYGSAKSFTKRANEFISNGKITDETARIDSDNLYDTREGELHNKKVCITWGNTKSDKFIQNPEFYDEIAKLMVTEGSAKNRKEAVNKNKEIIKKAKIEAADGQSMISLAYKKRYLGQLGKLKASDAKIIDNLIKIFDKASNYIEADNFEALKKLEKDVIDPLYKQQYATDYIASSIKQFASTILNNPETRRSTATQRKNSEVCVEDIKTLLATKNYFMIRLMAHMNRNGIDCIDEPTTVKEGLKKVFNPNLENFFDEFDKIISTNDTGALEFDKDLVNLIPMKDVLEVQEMTPHALDRDDIFGTQITRLLPSTIDRTGNTHYYLYKFGSDEKVEITGDELYKAIQKVYDVKIKNNIKNVKKKFGISSTIEKKLQNGEPLTSKEQLALNKALAEILQSTSKYSDTDYRFTINPVTGEFAYPINEFTSATELSKAIASVLKNDVVANNVPGGQLVQVTSALNTLFYKLKNKIALDESDKEQLDENLECKITKYPDGSLKEVYMEAEIPFMYKDAIGEYIKEDKNGVLTIDMDVVPEELKHGIFYRIPTEGLCSIFHIKVKRFTYGMADHVKLPAEITQLAGLDFDIDKLFTFIASMKKNKDGKLEYVKPDLNNLENNTSKEMINNALFELLLTTLNSPTGINGYNEFGGYEPVKLQGLAIYLAINEYLNQPAENKKSIVEIYNKKMSLLKNNKDEILNEFADLNKLQSPCDVLTNIKIQATNFENKDMLGISANNNALNAELAQLEIYLNTPIFSSGVTIGNSKIVNSNKTKFCPKNTVSGKEACVNLIRQILAASADVGKDAFLSQIGFNKFSIGIWNGLMNLGCDLEDALLFLQHPIIRQFSDEYKKMSFSEDYNVTPLTVMKKKSIIGKGKDKEQTYDDAFLGLKPNQSFPELNISREELINDLAKTYSDFSGKSTFENNTKAEAIERFIYFLLKNNSEMITLSSLLKSDSKSNVSWNSTYGLIANLTNFENFKSDVVNGNTTFDTSILEVFGTNGSTNGISTINTVPRLATLMAEMPNLVSMILKTHNPNLFDKLLTITKDICKKTGKFIKESDVRNIYNIYTLTQFADPNNKLHEYFKYDSLDARANLLKSIILAKEVLLDRYKNNAFLLNLEEEKLTQSTLGKYPSLSGLNTQKISLDPSKISQSVEEQIKTDIIQLLLSKDKLAVDFVNNVFVLSIVQSGFNKYNSRSPLRYYNEAALTNVLSGDYLKYFTKSTYDSESPHPEVSYKDINTTYGNEDLNKVEEFIIASLPYLVQYESAAESGEYRRNSDNNILKPAGNGVYEEVAKKGLNGVTMEYNSIDKYESNIKENNPENPYYTSYEDVTEITSQNSNNFTEDDQFKKHCIKQ